MSSVEVADDYVARTMNTEGLRAQMLRFLATPAHEEPYVAGRPSLDRLNYLSSDLYLHLTPFPCASSKMQSGKASL